MDLETTAHFLNGFLMIAIPILLGMELTHRFKMGWKVWLIGAAVFIISQAVHIPFNSFILNPLLTTFQQAMARIPGTLVVAILLGLSAGIFETLARYAMFRWWIKDHLTWRIGVLAGAGHGGAEAIILGVLVFMGYINMMVYRNMDLGTLKFSPEQVTMLSQQLQAYWSLPWYGALLGAVERIFTIPFHIAASVLVLQVFTRKPGQEQLGWLGLAILLHSMMDGTAVFVSTLYGPYITELLLGLLAVLDIFIIFMLRQLEPDETTPTPPSTEPRRLVFTPAAPEETSDNLDKTRYQ